MARLMCQSEPSRVELERTRSPPTPKVVLPLRDHEVGSRLIPCDCVRLPRPINPLISVRGRQLSRVLAAGLSFARPGSKLTMRIVI